MDFGMMVWVVGDEMGIVWVVSIMIDGVNIMIEYDDMLLL